jgi:hypothetical protein
MTNNINYQQIFEEEVGHTTREGAGLDERFFELPHAKRMLVEELVDAGYRRALEEVLDPEVIAETAGLAAEMGTQLYNFANMLQVYLTEQDDIPAG